MPRVISFIVLLAIVLLVGAVFFQVMAQFIVPLFLACVLLVVFQPLHQWILSQLPRHPRIGALFTTVLILLMVLLPLVWLGWNAYVELHTFFTPAQQSVASASSPPVASDTPDAAQALENKEEEEAFTAKIKKRAFELRDYVQNLTGLTVTDASVERMVSTGSQFVVTKALSGVQSALGLLIGLAIMVISLYYFLADGPVMIGAAMDLSPLDANYEQELLQRFGDVSRAVVVATLLSAVVQGILAGFGYYFALPSGAPIFLLTALTMVTAMVPFVGAAAMWVCVCVWVYLYGEHTVNGAVTQGDPFTAIVLAIYCTIVVSGIDNVIKPLVLHGQSKLHPLLALLSILGGVQALGPVGILVGPMLVSFLQALLNMLRKEIDWLGGSVVDPSKPLAESMAEAIQHATGENPAGSAPNAPAQLAESGGNSGKSPQASAEAGQARRSKRKR